MEKALKGYEAQLGKDHEMTKICEKNFSMCLNARENSSRLTKLQEEYSWL